MDRDDRQNQLGAEGVAEGCCGRRDLVERRDGEWKYEERVGGIAEDDGSEVQAGRDGRQGGTAPAAVVCREAGPLQLALMISAGTSRWLSDSNVISCWFTITDGGQVGWGAGRAVRQGQMQVRFPFRF